MQIRDVMRMLNGVEAKFIRRAVDAGFDPGSGKPDRKAVRMMISTRRGLVEHPIFDTRRSTKLSREHHDGLFHQTSSFQIFQQAGDGFVDSLTRSRMILLKLAMRIPFAVVAEIHQRVSNSAFGKPASGQTALSVVYF